MKLYMAGPLFTTAERDFNTALCCELREHHHQVWLPQESEQTPPVTAQGIFLKDVRGVDWADIILACMDGPDPDSGTCWECGAAFRRKPVIAYRTDIRDVDDGFPPFNLMITQSAFVVLNAKWKTVPEIAALIQAAILTISKDSLDAAAGK